MKIVIEKGSSGGGLSTEAAQFFAEGRNSLKNMLSRQEITWRVCGKKNLGQKFDLTQKLEQFFKKNVGPPKFDLILLKIPTVCKEEFQKVRYWNPLIFDQIYKNKVFFT